MGLAFLLVFVFTFQLLWLFPVGSRKSKLQTGISNSLTAPVVVGGPQEVRTNPQGQFCGVDASGSVLRWCSRSSDVEEIHISKDEEGLRGKARPFQAHTPRLVLFRAPRGKLGLCHPASRAPPGAPAPVTQLCHLLSGRPGLCFPVFEEAEKECPPGCAWMPWMREQHAQRWLCAGSRNLECLHGRLRYFPGDISLEGFACSNSASKAMLCRFAE